MGRFIVILLLIASAQAPPVVLVARPRIADAIGPDFRGRVEGEPLAVRSPADGTVTKVLVQAGAAVKKGDLLFELDLAGLQYDLKLTTETVRLLEDWLAQLDEGLRKAAKNAKKSREDVDVLTAERDLAAARLAFARLTADQVRQDLGKARVVAPIDGKVIQVSAQPGDRVTVGAVLGTPLCTIAPADVRVSFEVEEQCLLRLRQLLREGKIKKFSDVEVLLGLDKEEGFPFRGRLDQVDVRIDAKTERARLVALIPGGDAKLAAEKSVRVRLVTSRTLLVPDPAVQTDPQGGKYLLIVTEKNTVETRSVKIGEARGGWRTIESGLAPEDWIAVGSERMKQGQDVKISAEDFARDLLLLRVKPGTVVAPFPVELPK